MHELEGVWQPLYAELGGEEAPKMLLEKMELELAAGTYTVRFGGVAADTGSYVIDAAGLTLAGMAGTNAGRTIPCIYKFVGETLAICYGLSGSRPRNFFTGGDSLLYLVNYTRKQ